MLVLLSDIDGLYTADPRQDPDARHIAVVREIGSEIEAMAGSAPPGYSSGGMVTKLAAARIAMGAGCRMLIAQGGRDATAPLAAIEAGGRATCSCRRREPRSARKAWIAGTVNPAGALIVDDGAARRCAGQEPAAGRGGRGRGHVRARRRVVIRTRAGREAGRGLSAYASGDIRRIAGHKSGEIAAILGYRGRDEIIHRDDLVVTETA